MANSRVPCDGACILSLTYNFNMMCPPMADAATLTDPQVPETDSVSPPEPEPEPKYRWGEWGAALFENPAYRKAFLHAVQDILDEIRDTCLPIPEPSDTDDESLDGRSSAEALLSSGNDIELRQLLDPATFGLLKPGVTPPSAKERGHKPTYLPTALLSTTSTSVSSAGGTQTLPPSNASSPWLPSDNVSELSPIVARVTASEPLRLEAKLNQLRAMVPYIRRRILFGVHWVSYAEEMEQVASGEAVSVNSLAVNLNHRFLQHQVSTEILQDVGTRGLQDFRGSCFY